MARARKLFPIYGSALANSMLVVLARERVVEHFVAGYVAENDRRGILGEPGRERELAETIGREMVLALTIETRDALPRFFGKQKVSKLNPEEVQAVEVFFRELVAAVERAKNWNAEDRRQFRRDLAFYLEFREQQGTPSARQRQSNRRSSEEPPFVARVALLLDPSMLEQARRAARKLLASLPPVARRLLRQTLRPSQR